MNKDVISYAIKDLKNVIIRIETKASLDKEDYIEIEKELNSFLSNLSIYKLRNIKEKNILLSGFQYAFNLMKHEKKITTIRRIKKGGFTFPIKFPFTCPCNKIYWIDISNIKPKQKYIKQYDCYLKALNNKKIIETIDDLEKILIDNE